MRHILIGLTIASFLALAPMARAEVCDLSIPRDTSFAAWSTYLKIRKTHPEIRLDQAIIPTGVKLDRDVVYSHETTRPLHADVARPDNDSVYPAVIMIHGGGWNSGHKGLQLPMALMLAEKGYVAIPVEYRLIPEQVYPAGLHDIKTAVRWVRSHAKELGVDPERIAVAGCSAGAQLATLVGVTNGSTRHEGVGDWAATSSDANAIVSIDGVATFISPSNYQDAYERLAKRGEKPVNAKWLGGMPHEAHDNWDEASAIGWITPASAPICFINSDLPRYSDGRDALRAIYDNLGIYSEAHFVGSDFHPFWLFEQYAPATVELTAKFLDKIFKQDLPASK